MSETEIAYYLDPVLVEKFYFTRIVVLTGTSECLPNETDVPVRTTVRVKIFLLDGCQGVNIGCQDVTVFVETKCVFVSFFPF